MYVLHRHLGGRIVPSVSITSQRVQHAARDQTSEKERVSFALRYVFKRDRTPLCGRGGRGAANPPPRCRALPPNLPALILETGIHASDVIGARAANAHLDIQFLSPCASRKKIRESRKNESPPRYTRVNHFSGRVPVQAASFPLLPVLLSPGLLAPVPLFAPPPPL